MLPDSIMRWRLACGTKRFYGGGKDTTEAYGITQLESKSNIKSTAKTRRIAYPLLMCRSTYQDEIFPYIWSATEGLENPAVELEAASTKFWRKEHM